MLALAPLDVICALGRLILIAEGVDHLLGIFKFIKTVLEEASLLEMLNVRIAGFEFVELAAKRVEDLSDRCVVR